MKIRVNAKSKSLIAAALLAGGLINASCTHDETEAMSVANGDLRFSMTEDKNWSSTATAGTRSASEAEAETYPSEVFTLDGGNDADTLYIHSLVNDGIESDSLGQPEVLTRAAPVTDMAAYGAFGVFGYSYTGSWDDSQTPNLMYNIEVQQQASVWRPSSSYFWPGSGKKVKFFGYAPYNAAGVTLSAPTVPGSPLLTYTVPSAVADQKDLLVAQSAELAGNHNAAAPLTFTHALTAVKFVVGDDLISCSINKISLKGVAGAAMYDIGGAWTPFASQDFSQTLSAYSGTPGTAITSPAQTFMMIPQILPAGALIEVELTDNLTSTTWTLTASIAGKEWPEGKTVTYKISSTSIDVQYVLNVSSSVEFTYEGGTSNGFSLTTNSTTSGPGHSPVTQHVPAWISDYSTDGGTTWNTWTTGSVPWILSIANFQSVPYPAVYNVTIAAQNGTATSIQNTALRATTAVASYDLSTKGGTTARNTANCYVVNGPGTYSLPLVYGNAIRNGMMNSQAYVGISASGGLTNFLKADGTAITGPNIAGAASATLVWQDADGLVSNVALNGGNLTFTVDQVTIQQGNAIVAVRNSSNQIEWSWHIWVTNYKLGTGQQDVTNNNNAPYTFMTYSIGWCDPSSMVYNQRSVLLKVKQMYSGIEKICEIKQNAATLSTSGSNPYFQWGRKDPMLGGVLKYSPVAGQSDKDCYTTNSTYEFRITNNKATIGNGIRNPNVFYNPNMMVEDDWCTTPYRNLWNANSVATTVDDIIPIKTVYDPSPVGYVMPPSGAFTGFTYGGGSFPGATLNTPAGSYNELSSNFGMAFWCYKMLSPATPNTAGGNIFFYAPGMREESILFGVGNFAGYWTAGAAVTSGYNTSYSLRFATDGVSPVNTGYGRAYGFSVRPIAQ